MGPHHQRLTPAHAGKILFMPLPFLSPWAHPRTCGEDEKVSLIVFLRTGSHPRMRGRLSERGLIQKFAGLTPSCTGKMPGLRLGVLLSAAHPRACGEDVLSSLSPIFVIGSPPRMRGLSSAWSTGGTAAGLTPAHAGKIL